MLILLLLDFQQLQTCERVRIIKPSLSESFFQTETLSLREAGAGAQLEGALLELMMWLMRGAAQHLHCPLLLPSPRATTSSTIPPLV